MDATFACYIKFTFKIMTTAVSRTSFRERPELRSKLYWLDIDVTFDDITRQQQMISSRVVVRRPPWPCCMETLRDPFGRLRGFDHATRTNFALPSLVIRLSDLTAIATSVARRASRWDFNVSPMTRL